MSEGLFWSPAVHWGFQIAVYLFLGGLAGGAYVSGYIADYLTSKSFRTDFIADLLSMDANSEEEYLARRETARWGMYISVTSIGVGGIALITHLGQPLRALFFPITFTNYGSWMVIGTWTIIIFTLWAVVQAFWYTFGSAVEGEAGTSLVFRRLISKYVRLDPGSEDRSPLVGYLDWFADFTRPPRKLWLVFGAVGVVLGLVLIAYTALLISAVESVALWDRSFLPFLFLMSGISTGIAAASGLTILFEGLSETIHQFSLADDAFIVVELMILGALLSTLDTKGLSGAITQYLINGPDAVLFWGFIVVAGLVTPVFVSLAITAVCYPEGHEGLSGRMHDLVHAGYVAKYALVLFGGFFLRFVILLVAVQQPYIPVGVPGL